MPTLDCSMTLSPHHHHQTCGPRFKGDICSQKLGIGGIGGLRTDGGVYKFGHSHCKMCGMMTNFFPHPIDVCGNLASDG